MYDLDAYYLYEHCGYNISKIEKINDKSIRMSRGHTIKKVDFDRLCYKLTNQEADLFKREAIKKLSDITYDIKKLNTEICLLEKALINSRFVGIKTDELQAELNRLANYIKSLDLKPIEVGNKSIEFCKYGTTLQETRNEGSWL